MKSKETYLNIIYVFVVAAVIHYKNYKKSLPPSLLQCKCHSNFSIYKMNIFVLSHKLLKFLMQNMCTFKLSTNMSITLQSVEYSILTSVTPIPVI